MTSHRAPPPNRSRAPAWVAAGAVLVALAAGFAMHLGDAISPQAADAPLLPTRTSAWPTPGRIFPSDLNPPHYQPCTEGDDTCPPPVDDASASGPVWPKRTVRPVTSTSGPFRVSTVTGAAGSVNPQQESPREQVGASSGEPTDRSGTPGSSTPTESTRSTPRDSQPTTTPLETTTATQTVTATVTETTTAPAIDLPDVSEEP